MKHKKIIKYISNISFGVGAALGAYAFYSIIKSRASLPEGVCPVDNSRPFIIIAIIFLAISFVASFFMEKKKKSDDIE
ncbi:MAG: hypothetical protein PHO15_05335 [Eubacteriales bacterium]|nr:hypothetical protein [Eubacteriales bacterium]